MNRICYFFFGLLALLVSQQANATTHIITFADFAYTPQILQGVKVGDTVEWQGAFANHPLASLVVPTGASPFANSSGTTFRYPVTTAGQYGYRCTLHGSVTGQGMAGGFVVEASGVEETLLLQLAATQNPFRSITGIKFNLESAEKVEVSVVNSLGIIVSLNNETLNAGQSLLPIDLTSQPSGSYQAILRSGNRILGAVKLIKE
jgi:plastocyanin